MIVEGVLTPSSAQAAEQVHSWVARHLPDRPHPPIKRPINWVRWISTLTVLSGSLTASYVAWPYLLPVIQNRTVWAAITLISILLFTSGHMFNQIRQVPYITGDGKGGISYFASGFQNQNGLETQIVAAICKFYKSISVHVLLFPVLGAACCILSNQKQMVSSLCPESPWPSRSPASATPVPRASPSSPGPACSSSCTARS